MPRWPGLLFLGLLYTACEVPIETETTGVIMIPQDQTTIQAGIEAAQEGDTVLVEPGTYVENINFVGKNIVVGSLYMTTGDTSYISRTVIDGNKNGSVVTFERGEDSTAVLTGFTITNGFARHGGGILCANSSPTLVGLVIRGNSTFSEWGKGGGIYYSGSGSGANLSKAKILDNSASNGGGGIAFSNSSNSSMVNVVVSGNAVDGIYCEISKAILILVNVTISRNRGKWGGGGIMSLEYNLILVNSIVWGNLSNEIDTLYSSVEASYSDIQGGWEGEGNIAVDPKFVDPENGDFRLQEGSPCIDGGNPASEYNDADGSRNDMGAYGGPGWDW